MRFCWIPIVITSVLVLACAPGTIAGPKTGGPRIVELRVFPPVLELTDARDARMVVVSGRMPNGYWVDLTDRAVYKPAAPIVKRDTDGFFHPVKPGSTRLTVSHSGQTATMPITVKGVTNPPISFTREIMPILSRTGCNAGTCHGSAKGKNGFKLSLRGYDPDFDYHALVDDILGRRFNRAQPAESLMLQKPVQTVAHQGGLVFEPNTRFYSTIYRWIAEGVKSDTDKAKRANRLEILPKNPTMSLPGEKQRLIVIAHYPDGTTRDVTSDAVFTTSMKDVATISEGGEIKAVRRGESAVLVRYEGNYGVNEVTVIGDRTGYKWAGQPQYNYIDKLVDAKLQRIKAVPSAVCSDGDLMRRASLDIIGLPPTPDEARAFLTDKTPSREKRAKLIDRRLDSPDFAYNWTNKWSDLLQVNRKYLGERGTWKFRNWIQEQVATNRPYNEFVRDIITASGSSYEHPASSYFRVARDPNQATENVTQLFLGIRFSCNKCHDHPFERWTQSQYYHFAANFARVGFRPTAAEGDEDVYDRGSGEVNHPKTNAVMTADFPYTFNASLEKANSRREALANWLTAKENPLFAKAMANRMWSYFLGRGIIDPVDDIRQGNPPCNKELIEALTTDFIKGGFDLKRLMRTICNSRTYQASINSNKWNRDDSVNFSHALPRRLTAEQLVDAITRATGSIQKYPGVPLGFRAVQLPDSTVASGGFLDLFGRPPRESPCECERSSTVSLGQALNLINGAMTNDTVSDPKGHIAKLMKTNPDERKIVEEMYLAAWCRIPTEIEVKKALPLFDYSKKRIDEILGAAADKGDIDMPVEEAKRKIKSEAAQDLLWGLLNSPGFLFNR